MQLGEDKTRASRSLSLTGSDLESLRPLDLRRMRAINLVDTTCRYCRAASPSSIERESRQKHTLSDRSVRRHGSPAIYPSSCQTMIQPALEARSSSRGASSARQYQSDALSGPWPTLAPPPPRAREKRRDVLSDR